jgi:hypothetical protein
MKTSFSFRNRIILICLQLRAIMGFIIIGKQPFLRRPCQIWYAVFTSLGFATIKFLKSKALSLKSNPQPGGPDLCMYVPQ